MLTPEYLLLISEGGEDIAEYLHIYTIQKIIDRIIARLDHGDDYRLTATDKWQIQTLQEAGYLLEDIQREISQKTGLMLTEIQEAMEDAGVKAMEYDDSIYRAAGLSPKPLEQSPHLIRLMQSTYEATVGDWKNFAGTFADAAQQTFMRACDEAYMKVASGTVSYSQALVEAVEAIAKDGVEVTYPTGHTDTIETATLRCIRTGVGQASARIQLARMDEMGVDLVLVSSHLGARPEHELWQGKIYSTTRYHEKYSYFQEATKYGTVTGLCGANCRHSFGPYIEGMHNPFDDYDSDENREAYETQQRQRTLERRIRKTKRECMGLQEAISKAKTPEAVEKLTRTYERKAALLAKQNAAYNDYCDQQNLKRLSERLTIAKWDRSQAAKARAAAKRYAVDHPDSVVPKPYQPRANKVEKIIDPYSFEERRKKLSIVQASSTTDAIDIAKEKGIRYPLFDKMDMEQVNNMLNAVDTLPADCRPAVIANGKNISILTGRPLGRKADQWWGVTYDYRDFSLRTMQLGYDKTDYDGGLLVGFNTAKYKKLDALTKAKEANNEKYFAKTGRYWSFNTDGRATAYHEFGHCFVDVRGLPENWEALSTRWAEESKCDILRKPDEAFAEAWAAFHMADERLPDYISDAILEAIGVK